jgi:hypothetical protein
MATTDQVMGRRNTGGAPGPRILWPAGAVAVVVAAAATTVLAVVGRALGAPIAVDGDAIPLVAFPMFTVIAGAAGIALAVALNRWTRRPRRTFTVTTVVLTVLSLVPDLLVEVTPGSRIVLMLTHLVAAVIVIPTLGRRLPTG